MELVQDELTAYRRNGYLLKGDCFSSKEIEIMKAQFNKVVEVDGPQRISETNGLIRSVYGLHTTNEVFKRLVRHPTLLHPATQILQSEAYVYQFKINVKAALGGDVWKWHQDFIFWNKEDGLPEPRLINISIFLDDVTEFNGPMMIIPGSHMPGMIEREPSSPKTGSEENVAWANHLSADLKYSADQDLLAKLVRSNGIVAPKGTAGSVLFFDPNLLHGSATNISPFNRTLIIVTYNSVANQPTMGASYRPEFLVSKHTKPLRVLSNDCILQCASAI
jgi:ectoine hydroxylase-related dioxygenase (phytanoyl-CoA dioxygenase family)